MVSGTSRALVPSQQANDRRAAAASVGNVRFMDDVASLRALIDEHDAEIVRLVAERRELSRRIQAARAAGGGGPLAPEREREIQDAYAASLGPDGREVASAVLVVCRGRH
jgi:chorismate mutase